MQEQRIDIKTIINEAAMASKTADKSTDSTTSAPDTFVQETSKTQDVNLDLETPVAIPNERKMPKVYNEIQGESFAWDVITEQQIIIEDIKDEQGYLSQKIEALLEKYEINTIPLQVTDILPQVTELKEHDLINVDGITYAMSRGCNRERIIQYRDDIAASLKAGLPYKKSLLIDVKLENGETFKTLDMTQTEWNFVCSLYRKYKPRLIITEDNDFILLVG